ncbi:MAG: hypothetical protein HY084_07415 [Gemmatimonadetes bacterium]|nr:hypothetical protein [Gemmatimonadota bacterium]
MTASSGPAGQATPGFQTTQDTLAAAEVADDFAQHLLPQAIPQARAVVAVVTAAIVVFALSDYDIFGFSRTFWVLSAFRAVLVVCGVVAFTRLRPDVSSRTLRTTLFVYTLLVAGFFTALAPIRTLETLSYPLVGLALVMLSYLILPLPPRLQFWPAIVASSGVMWWAFHGGATALMRIATSVVFVGGNVAGSLVSSQLRSWQRRHFLALRGQADAVARLEQALAEVRALRGILPICSFCKNVRDDRGYWQEVEVYMRAHSTTEFSHSICPECLHEHYPEHAAAVLESIK